MTRWRHRAGWWRRVRHRIRKRARFVPVALLIIAGLWVLLDRLNPKVTPPPPRPPEVGALPP